MAPPQRQVLPHSALIQWTVVHPRQRALLAFLLALTFASPGVTAAACSPFQSATQATVIAAGGHFAVAPAIRVQCSALLNGPNTLRFAGAFNAIPVAQPANAFSFAVQREAHLPRLLDSTRGCTRYRAPPPAPRLA